MATLDVYNAQKEKVGEITLDDSIFGVEPNVGLLHEVVKWQLARRRTGNACAKTRSEVSGGGKKPWRQKGTGRARAGSTRSPVWRHGGAAFGPKPRDYDYTLPKKVRKLGLRMALSDKVKNDRLVILDDFGIDRIKTRDMVGLLKRLDVRKAVIVTDVPDEKLELSARNIPHIKVLPQGGLNVFDLLKYEYVIMKEPVVELIEERLRS
ncbi:MAG TPA: 50S ribosomal protein L4 [Thermodesulfobacteriaceae bacterium]|nr:50S ribosomal protein L4 [Thermodesulfobacteriaceae bacterium]